MFPQTLTLSIFLCLALSQWAFAAPSPLGLEPTIEVEKSPPLEESQETPKLLPTAEEAAQAVEAEIREQEALYEQGLDEEPLEKPVPNQGRYFALGIHFTSAMMDDANRGSRGPGPGYGFSLRLGESVTEKFDLGLTFDWGTSKGDAKLSFGRLTVHSQYQLGDRWYALGGFGFAGVSGPDKEDRAYGRGSFGDAYILGLGRNIFLTDANKSGGSVLSPVVSLEYLPHGDFQTTVLWVGVEISWWSGLPRDQLDLPFDEAYDSLPH